MLVRDNECGVDGIPPCHAKPGATDANWCHACLLAEYRKAHRERDELAAAWKTRNETPPPDTAAWNALLAKACAERDAALTRDLAARPVTRAQLRAAMRRVAYAQWGAGDVRLSDAELDAIEKEVCP